MGSLDFVKERARRDARQHGIYLTPEPDNLDKLLDGLRENEDRYGYPSCPCRLATGSFELDRDIICPCDYRDPDVAEFGSCFCNLYVDQEIFERKKKAITVPERRPSEKQYAVFGLDEETSITEDLTVITRKVYYCKQCGYMTFREDPPYICPICQAKRELFENVKVRMIA
jgi:ferredoxin-thioredoxin reductase catalytic subunit